MFKIGIPKLASQLSKQVRNGNSFVRHYGEFSTHILYAIILGALFQIGATAYVPLQDVFQYKETYVHCLAIVVIYFILIAGWISFTREVHERPHRDGNLGITRFATDLVIMTLLFYLVSLVNIDNFAKSYSHTFLWVMPTLFMAYCIWDVLELKEYGKESRKLRYAILSQFRKSLRGFGLALIQAFVFAVLSSFFWNYEMYFIFTITNGFIVLHYRISGWNVATFRLGSVKKRKL